jgi:cholestenol delta-isomerase
MSGFFIVFRDGMPGMDSLFAQLWKEYTLSDSRYLSLDVFTVVVETITVFAWGPLSWLAVVAIIRGSPIRHVVQVILCTAHLYGVFLYYLTCEVEFWWHGVTYSRPEPVYYWLYYVGFNAPWVFVPSGE